MVTFSEQVASVAGLGIVLNNWFESPSSSLDCLMSLRGSSLGLRSVLNVSVCRENLVFKRLRPRCFCLGVSEKHNFNILSND